MANFPPDQWNQMDPALAGVDPFAQGAPPEGYENVQTPEQEAQWQQFIASLGPRPVPQFAPKLSGGPSAPGEGVGGEIDFASQPTPDEIAWSQSPVAAQPQPSTPSISDDERAAFKSKYGVTPEEALAIKGKVESGNQELILSGGADAGGGSESAGVSTTTSDTVSKRTRGGGEPTLMDGWTPTTGAQVESAYQGVAAAEAATAKARADEIARVNKEREDGQRAADLKFSIEADKSISMQEQARARNQQLSEMRSDPGRAMRNKSLPGKIMMGVAGALAGYLDVARGGNRLESVMAMIRHEMDSDMEAQKMDLQNMGFAAERASKDVYAQNSIADRLRGEADLYRNHTAALAGIADQVAAAKGMDEQAKAQARLMFTKEIMEREVKEAEIRARAEAAEMMSHTRIEAVKLTTGASRDNAKDRLDAARERFQHGIDVKTQEIGFTRSSKDPGKPVRFSEGLSPKDQRVARSDLTNIAIGLNAARELEKYTATNGGFARMLNDATTKSMRDELYNASEALYKTDRQGVMHTYDMAWLQNMVRDPSEFFANPDNYRAAIKQMRMMGNKVAQDSSGDTQASFDPEGRLRALESPTPQGQSGDVKVGEPRNAAAVE
jgi:hypothetical protein